MTTLHKFFGFSGRIRRLDYWLLNLALYLLLMSLDLVTWLVSHFGGFTLLLSPAWDAVGLAVAAVVLWGVDAVTLKRCHDRDRGWPWAAFCLLVPVVGWIVALIDLGFIEGTPGPNRFGPSPKGLGEAPLNLTV